MGVRDAIELAIAVITLFTLVTAPLLKLIKQTAISEITATLKSAENEKEHECMKESIKENKDDLEETRKTVNKHEGILQNLHIA